MTTAVLSTGSALGDYEGLAALDATGFDWTPLGHIPDPALREVVRKFSTCWREPLSAQRGFTCPARAPRRVIDTGTPDSTGMALVISTEVAFTGDDIGSMSSSWRAPGMLTVVVDENLPHAPATIWSRAFQDFTEEVSAFSGPRSADGADDIIETVLSIVKRLGVPVRDVLAAAQIVKSSYYLWTKSPTTRPRLASEGRLWELAQFVEDLEMLGGSPREWLRAQPERRPLLVAGKFAELLDMADAGPRPRREAPEYGDLYAIGGDRFEEDEPPRLPSQPATVSPATTTHQARRRR